MAIDFTALSKPFYVVVPVTNNSFVYHRKNYRVKADDGWYVVAISGNKATIDEPHVWSGTYTNLTTSYGVFGYTYNNNLIFQNFDVARRKWNLQIETPLHFNVIETFNSVRAVVWEDRRVYYTEPNYADITIYDVKQCYDSESSLDGMKGVTPELRTLFLFHILQREQQRKILEEAQRAATEQRRIADEAEQMKDVAYRLAVTFGRAGAKVIQFSQAGNNLIVDWELDRHRFNSVIDSRTWMVREAGICVSGDDKRHNITSIVKTAEEYVERRVLHVTRSNAAPVRNDQELDPYLRNHYHDPLQDDWEEDDAYED